MSGLPSLPNSGPMIGLPCSNELERSNSKSMKEETLLLSWTIRERMVSNLNNHTTALKYQTSPAIRSGLFKENNHLIHLLLNLPIKPKEMKISVEATSGTVQVSAQPSSLHLVRNDHSKVQGNPILELSYGLRDLIVLNLFKNHTAVLLANDQPTCQANPELATENNELVDLLMTLPASTEASGYFAETLQAEYTSTIEPDNEWNKSTDKRVELDQPSQVESLRVEMDKQLSNLRNELTEKLKKELDPGRAVCKFNFVITDGKKFYKDRKKRISAPHFCRNLLWSIDARFNEKGKDSFLAVYLNCITSFPEYSFSVKVNYQLRLVAQVEGAKDKVVNYTITFTSDNNCYGNSAFIDWNEFFDPQSGFRKNDSFVIQVEIKADLVKILKIC